MHVRDLRRIVIGNLNFGWPRCFYLMICPRGIAYLTILFSLMFVCFFFLLIPPVFLYFNFNLLNRKKI